MDKAITLADDGDKWRLTIPTPEGDHVAVGGLSFVLEFARKNLSNKSMTGGYTVVDRMDRDKEIDSLRETVARLQAEKAEMPFRGSVDKLQEAYDAAIDRIGLLEAEGGRLADRIERLKEERDSAKDDMIQFTKNICTHMGIQWVASSACRAAILDGVRKLKLFAAANNKRDHDVSTRYFDLMNRLKVLSKKCKESEEDCVAITSQFNALQAAYDKLSLVTDGIRSRAEEIVDTLESLSRPESPNKG